MKVSVELNVSEEEFYDVMIHSLQEDVLNSTKKKLELKEGLKYKKNLLREQALVLKLQFRLSN